MNEVRALVEAFDDANTRGERCALATVVSVEGSSYRQPGARMLIRETGTNTGAISAGCLEPDVIEHAKHVIRTGKSKIVEYNTASTSDEMAWGLGLGCNGIVRVLVEPLQPESLYVEALRRSCEPNAVPVLVATVYRHEPAEDGVGIESGARILIGDDGIVRSQNLSGPLARMLENEIRALPAVAVSLGTHTVDIGTSAVTVFIESLMPPVPIVIFGAGPDVQPIVELARGLGWQTEVVDPQARPSSFERFATADKVTLVRPEDVAAKVTITQRTLALLMTHNYSHDAKLLSFLLRTPARYIGVMGPRARTERILGELAADEELFRLKKTYGSRLHSPVGLDIGATSSAEIAVSIIAEMRAVLEGRRGGMLRERRGSIHGNDVHEECVTFRHSEVLALA